MFMPGMPNPFYQTLGMRRKGTVFRYSAILSHGKESGCQVVAPMRLNKVSGTGSTLTLPIRIERDRVAELCYNPIERKDVRII